MLDCDKKSIYVGISTDIQRRYQEHLSGDKKGARYTRSHRLLELIYSLKIGDKSLALKVEHRLKKKSATWKRSLALKPMKAGKLFEALSLDA